MMASAQKQNNMSIIQSQLNEALEQYEEDKEILRALLKVKIYHDRESFRFLIEKMKKKCDKELEKEDQKHSEPEHQNEVNLGVVLDFSVEQEKSSDNMNKDVLEYPRHSMKSVSNGKVLTTKRTKFHQRLRNLFYCCFKNQESELAEMKSKYEEQPSI